MLYIQCIVQVELNVMLALTLLFVILKVYNNLVNFTVNLVDYPLNLNAFKSRFI